MRHHTWITLAFASLVFLGCGKKEEPAPAKEEPTMEQTAEAAAKTISELAEHAKVALAAFGGIVFSAAGHNLEVLPYQNGEIVAAFRTDAGIVSANTGASIEVTVMGANGQPHVVPLEWDPERLRYVGDAGVTLTKGPVAVQVEAEGKTDTAKVPVAAVAPPPDNGGTSLVAGEVGAELQVRADGLVAARVVDSNGNTLGDLESVVVEVEAEAEDQAAEPIQLTWNAEQKLYLARTPLSAKIATRPVQLVVNRKGALHRGRLSDVVVTRIPEAGGRVIVAGTHQIELVPTDEGVVEAIVIGPSGAVLHADANARSKLMLMVDGKETPLEWDPTLLRFRGKVSADLSAAPVRVSLLANGRRYRGRIRGVTRVDAVRAAQLDVAAPGAAEASMGGRLKMRAVQPRGVGPIKAMDVRAQGAAARLKNAGRVKAGAGAARVDVSAGGNVRAAAGQARANTAAADGDDEESRGKAKARLKVGGSAGVRVGN